MRDTRNDIHPSNKPIHPIISLDHHDHDHHSMTTKRATTSSYGHPHQQQRRPPDVEEALSSMLWTPYERASNTDTSSEDEDEQLNRQLRKSKSQYDYTSLPTIPPSPTPPPPPSLALPPASNIVAYIPTPKRVAPGNSCLVSGAAFYAPEDLCDASVTTPLVPFSNLMLAANPTLVTADVMAPNAANGIATATAIPVAVPLLHDVVHNNCYPNESTLAATSSSFASSLDNHKNRFSYGPSYGRIPGLSKWWSSTTASDSSHATPGTDNGTAQTVPPAAADAKQPPSYESLYSKQSHSAPTSALQRHSKHLKIFKPVLETLKANVTTIKQSRLAAITSAPTAPPSPMSASSPTAASSCSGTATPSSRQDNTRVNATNVTTNNSCSSNGCTTAIAGPHLVHSFTDDFLTEHCTRTQHVAATNADNEHIINNNFNGSNINCAITTIDESTEPAVQQQQSATNHDSHKQKLEIREETAHDIKAYEELGSPLIHQQLSDDKRDQNTKQMNSVSQQTEMEEEEDEYEINENNNFLEYEHQSRECDKMNTQTAVYAMNTTSSPAHGMVRDSRVYATYSPLVYCHSNQLVRVPVYEPTVAAISLTRSFEVNTTGYGGLTRVGLSQHTQTSDTNCKTSFDSTKSTAASVTVTTYELTPNKCLAELERLYAEFRASESLREKRLRETADAQDTDRSSETTENMRLNVPATSGNTPSSDMIVGVGAMTELVQAKTGDTKINPSTSSVFLTTTNSVTALTNPCQRTPSLTIQVNQNPSDLTANNQINNHYNNNNNNNNNNNVDIGENVEAQSKHFMNQATVQTIGAASSPTMPTKNGVSVINCNYVNNINNNNNNNNNSIIGNSKSITNFSESATKTNANLNHSSPTTNPNNSNSFIRSDKSSTHASSDASNTPPSGQSSSPYHSSVPKKINIENNINNNTNHQRNVNTPKDNSVHSIPNASVNVIQVNGFNTHSAITNASSSSPSRTFTSTECQTDDVGSVQLRSSRALPPLPTAAASTATLNNNRDQRRRERRERRHLQHTASMLVAPTHPHHGHHVGRHPHLDRHSMPAPPLPPILHPSHMHPGLSQSPHNVAMLRPMLPDILHNHFPPPYSALPHPAITMASSGSVPNHPNVSPMPSFGHHGPPPPPPPGATLLGPPPPPPPGGTTLLTSVISTVPIPGATPMVSDGRFTLPLPIIRRSPSERSGKGCCGQWFAGPPLRALIAVVALGGLACALGGAALGATGLAGPPSSHFTAALLMIGVGVVLVTVSGAAWRMTAPGGPPCLGLGSSVDLGRCGRRPCSRGGGAPQGLLYPEFQHRPPPPSYQASMQEYRLRLLLLDRDRQNGVVRGSSPPPTYRSHAGSLLRAPLTTTIRGVHGIASNGRTDSSVGGSEYSFPPSYRSRNNTPGTISSERSIETEPSGRLLANEDIPEPLSVEQLSEYNSLQQRTRQAGRRSLTPSVTMTMSTTTTAAIATATSMTNNVITTGSCHKQKSDEKRHGTLQLDQSCIITKKDSSSSGSNDKKDDLVTIVTITPQSNETTDMIENQNNANHDATQSAGVAREQIEILAHL